VTGSVNLLGGREKCWDDSQPRMAASFTGRFELGAYPWTLEIPDDEDFQVDFAGLTLNDTATAVEDMSGRTVANEGELVTVFGGYGSDGVFLVCAIEERHAA
jgi:hypothetical protein